MGWPRPRWGGRDGIVAVRSERQKRTRRGRAGGKGTNGMAREGLLVRLRWVVASSVVAVLLPGELLLVRRVVVLLLLLLLLQDPLRLGIRCLIYLRSAHSELCLPKEQCPTISIA